MLGAASLLGGSMRMTVSLCVILLELTNNLSLLPLIMIELLILKTIADSFKNSVYDKIVHLKVEGASIIGSTSWTIYESTHCRGCCHRSTGNPSQNTEGFKHSTDFEKH